MDSAKFGIGLTHAITLPGSPSSGKQDPKCSFGVFPQTLSGVLGSDTQVPAPRKAPWYGGEEIRATLACQA